MTISEILNNSSLTSKERITKAYQIANEDEKKGILDSQKKNKTMGDWLADLNNTYYKQPEPAEVNAIADSEPAEVTAIDVPESSEPDYSIQSPSSELGRQMGVGNQKRSYQILNQLPKEDQEAIKELQKNNPDQDVIAIGKKYLDEKYGDADAQAFKIGASAFPLGVAKAVTGLLDKLFPRDSNDTYSNQKITEFINAQQSKLENLERISKIAGNEKMINPDTIGEIASSMFIPFGATKKGVAALAGLAAGGTTYGKGKSELEAGVSATAGAAAGLVLKLGLDKITSKVYDGTVNKFANDLNLDQSRVYEDYSLLTGYKPRNNQEKLFSLLLAGGEDGQTMINAMSSNLEFSKLMSNVYDDLQKNIKSIGVLEGKVGGQIKTQDPKPIVGQGSLTSVIKEQVDAAQQVFLQNAKIMGTEVDGNPIGNILSSISEEGVEVPNKITIKTLSDLLADPKVNKKHKKPIRDYYQEQLDIAFPNQDTTRLNDVKDTLGLVTGKDTPMTAPRPGIIVSNLIKQQSAMDKGIGDNKEKVFREIVSDMNRGVEGKGYRKEYAKALRRMMSKDDWLDWETHLIRNLNESGQDTKKFSDYYNILEGTELLSDGAKQVRARLKQIHNSVSSLVGESPTSSILKMISQNKESSNLASDVTQKINYKIVGGLWEYAWAQGKALLGDKTSQFLIRLKEVENSISKMKSPKFNWDLYINQNQRRPFEKPEDSLPTDIVLDSINSVIEETKAQKMFYREMMDRIDNKHLKQYFDLPSKSPVGPQTKSKVLPISDLQKLSDMKITSKTTKGKISPPTLTIKVENNKPTIEVRGIENINGSLKRVPVLINTVGKIDDLKEFLKSDYKGIPINKLLN